MAYYLSSYTFPCQIKGPVRTRILKFVYDKKTTVYYFALRYCMRLSAVCEYCSTLRISYACIYHLFGKERISLKQASFDLQKTPVSWQGRRDSNTQPTVLETATLPLSHSPK